MTEPHSPTDAFRAARDLLLRHRDDYRAATSEFSWPTLDEFNWALDWFDVIAAEHPDREALRVVAADGAEARLSYAELAARSNQVANWLRDLGVRRGDRLLLMLGNVAPLWEVILAAMKLGAVIIPASTLLGSEDLTDWIARGRVRHVITEASHFTKFQEISGNWMRVVVGDAVAEPGADAAHDLSAGAAHSPAGGSTHSPGAAYPPVAGSTHSLSTDAAYGQAAGPAAGWQPYSRSRSASAEFTPDTITHASDPLLLYFTSGTTAQPKLVEHTHASYPAGHLSTMYWIGMQPGDVHLNISSPGWAKHAWSNVFAPWNAGATALVLGYDRFSATGLLDAIATHQVSTFCAPPTVWRMLIQSDLGGVVRSLRECVAAGEPLNPEVIEQVRRCWGITVRDGYGQTETTALVGNSPGQPVHLGSMGRPLPGYEVTLVDPVTGEAGDEGEICLDLARRPLGLMTGYRGDPERAAEAMRGGYYHTGDVATRDDYGYITYVGRTDDVFKASDYRISPFELESVLIEHEAVAEAAVVPSPDPLRLAVPKAYVTLAAGFAPSAETALAILGYARQRLAPYKRVRRLEFGGLPKTVSGKIRRVELREQENDRHSGDHRASAGGARGVTEFWEEDFPSLKA